jgi:hypothetical protein
VTSRGSSVLMLTIVLDVNGGTTGLLLNDPGFGE